MLGTITPEGSACKYKYIYIYILMLIAIFCYECDEDVQDPKLAEHLGKLGIDIK